ADRIGELGAAADEFLARGIVVEGFLGERADQKLQELGVDPRRLDGLWRLFGHGSSYWIVESVPAPPRASSISVRAISASARVFRSGASRSACFSRTPNGLIMHSAFTSASLGACSIPFQSTRTSADSTKSRRAFTTH